MLAIKKDFTPEEIVELLKTLGSVDFRRGSKGEYIFQTVCHNDSGGSYKLYYYPDSLQFHCYTECGDTFDVYDLVERALHLNFVESYRFICSFFGLKPLLRDGTERHEEIDDWDCIRRYQPLIKRQVENAAVELPTSLLNLYSRATPQEWVEEGIGIAAMDKFGIRFSIAENKIVIPDFNANGKLIGIRGRALNPEDTVRAKYLPMTIDGHTLNYPTSQNLYGLWANKDAIQRSKKILLFEGEKSVLKCETFYPNANFSVAVCGSHVGTVQRDMILRLGVKEVFIAFDKEFHELPSAESERYGDKLIKLARTFSPFATTYILWDEHGYLEYKDAPIDKGQGVFETLLHDKIEVETKTEDLRNRRKVDVKHGFTTTTRGN